MNPEEKCFRCKTIDVRNIRVAIGKIKISKGFGTDNISSYFLKLTMPYIENSLPTSLTHYSKGVNFPMIGKL